MADKKQNTVKIPNKLTVKELKEILSKYSDDDIVKVSGATSSSGD